MRASAGLRYDAAGARHGHVESWFLKANDPRSRRAIWLKWAVWAGDRAPMGAIAEAWAMAFTTSRGHVATKTAVPFGNSGVRFDRLGLGIAVDGCTLSSKEARGRVETGHRAIGYDLTIEPLDEPLLHCPSGWMYSGAWPAQKLASPIPNARISGHIEVEVAADEANAEASRDASNETWVVAEWPGMVGHHWGRRHAPLSAWGHCNAWDGGEDLVLEGASTGGGGPVRVAKSAQAMAEAYPNWKSWKPCL